MKRIIYLSFIAVLIFTCSNAFTQTIVMKALDGTTKLNGGSTVSGHLTEIDVLSAQQGIANCATCNQATISEFTIVIALSPATISFKNLILNEHKLTSVDVVYIKAGVEYYKTHMENVTVTGISESSGGETPTFSVSLAMDRIAWQQIKTAGTTGKTSYGWDIINNVEWLYY